MTVAEVDEHADEAVATTTDERSIAGPQLIFGEQGPAGDGDTLDETAPTGLEPIVRATGGLVTALGEMLDAPTSGATILAGDLTIDFEALHRPSGRVRLQLPSANVDDGVRRSRHPEPKGDATAVPWQNAAAAAGAGSHGRALELYQQEAAAAEQGDDHAGVAISYRLASREAEFLGRHDEANRLLRLAGKWYLNAAESAATPARARRETYVVAAKCFLQAGNLQLTASCVDRARSVDAALGTG